MCVCERGDIEREEKRERDYKKGHRERFVGLEKYTQASVHMWRLEDNFVKWIFLLLNEFWAGYQVCTAISQLFEPSYQPNF